jgi:uncharacterized protein (TIGR00255 family)
MMRSMTGFGVGEASLGAGRVALEARSVNHRFLDVRTRLPRELGEHGTYLEQLARTRLARGRIELNVRYESAAGSGLVLDKRRAVEALRALTELRDELGLTEPVPLTLLGSIPDLFVIGTEGNTEIVRAALATALDGALVRLETMRCTEGQHLMVDLQSRLKLVEALAAEISARAPELADRYRRRLHERIMRLLDGAASRIDADRLEQEVILFADHVDVSEELTRLASHCAQFASMLISGEPVGRRLEFLLQEMSREVNTIGSKANEAEIAFRVVELKAEIERMREQVQNVE